MASSSYGMDHQEASPSQSTIVLSIPVTDQNMKRKGRSSPPCKVEEDNTIRRLPSVVTGWLSAAEMEIHHGQKAEYFETAYLAAKEHKLKQEILEFIQGQALLAWQEAFLSAESFGMETYYASKILDITEKLGADNVSMVVYEILEERFQSLVNDPTSLDKVYPEYQILAIKRYRDYFASPLP